MNLADSASLQIGAEDRLILCGVPLYPAMAASAECLIYYENKFLIVDDRKRRSKKTIRWAKKDDHVIDMCWYKDRQCVILTKRQLHLLNVDTETIQAVTGLPADDVRSSYHRCTSYAGCILLCFSGPGATIEAWTAKKRVNRWEAPISCARDERICCFGLSSSILELTIAKSEQGSRFELRQRETMAVLWVIQLQFACYRLSSLDEHTWLLVPYYRVAQEFA